MTLAKQIKARLNHDCVAVIPPLYNNNELKQWNKIFDGVLAKQDASRTYVTAADFVQHNLLHRIFSFGLQSLIYEIMPSAELYHCHVYEIEKQQTISHIMGDDALDGWHRDIDCKHDFSQSEVQHISLFVYLSDVTEDSGCFEISTKKINYFPSFGNAETRFKLVGETGTTFLFDRKAFHRASPNKSNTPRRVLKLSFQTKHIYNHKRLLPAFKLVRDELAPSDLFLRQLFGDKTLVDDMLNFAEYFSPALNLTTRIPENANLPNVESLKDFTLMQNFRRYVRDCLFVANRLIRKCFPTLDHRPPKIAKGQLITEK